MGSRIRLLLVSVVLVLFSLFLCVCLLFVFRTTNLSSDLRNVKNVEYEPTSIKYQYYKRSKDQEESFGVVSLPNSISESEYQSQTDSDGNMYLFSNFGSVIFECSGSCFCSSHSRRTATSSSLLTKGLMVIVASVSSVVAHNYAKRDLDRVCQEKHGGISGCPENAIRSEIEECNIVTKDGGEATNDDSTEKEDTISPEILSAKYSGKYSCSGRCLTRNYDDTIGVSTQMLDLVGESMGLEIPSNEIPDEATEAGDRERANRLNDEALQFGCESHSLDEVIDFDECIAEVTKNNAMEKTKKSVLDHRKLTPEMCFYFGELDEYCTKISDFDAAKVLYGVDLEEMFKGEDEELLREVAKNAPFGNFGRGSWCSGSSLSILGATLGTMIDVKVPETEFGGYNPTVKCKRISDGKE